MFYTCRSNFPTLQAVICSSYIGKWFKKMWGRCYVSLFNCQIVLILFIITNLESIKEYLIRNYLNLWHFNTQEESSNSNVSTFCSVICTHCEKRFWFHWSILGWKYHLYPQQVFVGASVLSETAQWGSN